MNRPREEIIDAIGKEYRTMSPKTELGEWNYPLEYKKAGREFVGIKETNGTRTYSMLDLRFVDTKAMLPMRG